MLGRSTTTDARRQAGWLAGWIIDWRVGCLARLRAGGLSGWQRWLAVLAARPPGARIKFLSPSCLLAALAARLARTGVKFLSPSRWFAVLAAWPTVARVKFSTPPRWLAVLDPWPAGIIVKFLSPSRWLAVHQRPLGTGIAAPGSSPMLLRNRLPEAPRMPRNCIDTWEHYVEKAP